MEARLLHAHRPASTDPLPLYNLLRNATQYGKKKDGSGVFTLEARVFVLFRIIQHETVTVLIFARFGGRMEEG